MPNRDGRDDGDLEARAQVHAGKPGHDGKVAEHRGSQKVEVDRPVHRLEHSFLPAGDVEQIADHSRNAVRKITGNRRSSRERAKPLAHLERVGELLRRALTNLVENAIRHAPKNSEVELSSQARDGQIELRVTDRGTGVPESLRPHIFDAFVAGEVEARPSSRRGFGLGLAFYKLVAEAHRGSIGIDDVEQGAAFVIRIPG